jgi:hypothetical protein
MKNLLLATAFAAGLIAPAMAQEFAPQNNQATTHQRLLDQQASPNNGAQPGGTASSSPGWLSGTPQTTGTFNSETSQPYFVEHSHGSPHG